MQRSEIIELCNQLTERKGEKIFNMNSLYRLVLQDICKRERFWWRRVLVSFQLTAGTPTYDMTDTNIFASLANIAIEEITKFTVILAPSPLQKAELTPMFDPEAIIEMTFNTTAASPSRYTMDANSYTKLRIDPPDKNYTAYLVGWGMPNPPTDTPVDTVPLVPTWGHNAIVYGMNSKIFKYAYGASNKKTLDAIAEYEQGIQDLQERKKWDPNYVLQLTSSEQAIQST